MIKNIFLIFVFCSSIARAETILGTNDPETLNGTVNADYIASFGGDDYIYCGAGDDNCKGGDGNDHIYGNDGKDYLKGEAGNDYIWGNEKEDNIIGGPGTDVLIGGSDDRDFFIFYQGDGIDNIADFQHGVDKIVIYGFSGDYDDLEMTEQTENGVHSVIITADTVQIWFIPDMLSNFSSSDFIFLP